MAFTPSEGDDLREFFLVAQVLDKHGIKDADHLDFMLTPLTLGDGATLRGARPSITDAR